jgi:N-formylglutamate amidohydrolase
MNKRKFMKKLLYIYFLCIVFCISAANQRRKRYTTPVDNQTRFIFFQKGNIPILLTAPHGGELSVPFLKIRTRGKTVGDARTLQLTQAIAAAMANKTGLRPYVVGLRCKRKYVDANRPTNEAYEDERAQPIYDAYHRQILEYIKEIKEKFPHNNPLLIDIHGQAFKKNTIFRGTRNKQTVKKLLHRCGENALSGQKSIIKSLESYGYTVFPSSALKRKAEASAYWGGFTISNYGSHKRNGIDAIQLEFGSDFRQSNVINTVARTVAQAIIDFHKTWQTDEACE